MVAVIETSEPVLWFVARASGLVSLLALTLSVVLGIAAGARTTAVPRFVTQGLHRAAAMTGVLLLVVHICSVVMDPFVPLEWTDVVLPFDTDYLTLWTGLGTLAIDVLIVVVVSSLLRHRMGPRTWWLIHLSAYAAYGLSVAHGLGAGTDAGEPLVVAMTVGSVGAVLAALALRLWRSRGPNAPRHDAGLGPQQGAQA